jgi:glycosyltransferase involved in cell wall biosynthesis
MRIAIYSPDRHVVYDGATPDRTGVGGGVTARIRIAAAFARRGHRVEVICNCPAGGTFDGVRYVRLDDAREIHSDALVLHSSGGAHDLTPLLSMTVEDRVRVVVLSGIGLPKGTEEIAPASVYVCSNFLRGEIHARFGVPLDRLFVTHYGVNRWNFAGPFRRPRDIRRLIYSSHPSKGFDVSRAVLGRLREHDPRFELHCFGGNRLWGGADQPPAPEPGIVYRGLIRQRPLAAEYQQSGFALQLQTRPEPFGITVVEAMAAGAIVVASPVGSFRELIDHGRNGFLVEGDPADPGTAERAAGLIRDLCGDPALMERVRRAAYATPFLWDTIAEVWEQHFEWLLCTADPLGGALRARRPPGRLLAGPGGPARTRGSAVHPWSHCLECSAECLALADGYHCPRCGWFGRKCNSTSLSATGSPA